MTLNYKNILAGVGTGAILIIASIVGLAGFANYEFFNKNDVYIYEDSGYSVSESLAGENLCSYIGEYRETSSPNNIYFGSNGKVYSTSSKNRTITISGASGQFVYKKYKYFEDKDNDGQNEEYESTFFDPRAIAYYNEGGEEYMLVLEYGDKKNPGAVLKIKTNSQSELEMIYKWDNISGASIKPSDIKLIEGTQSSFLVINDYSSVLSLEVNDDYLQPFVSVSLPKKIVGIATAKGYLFLATTEVKQQQIENKILRYRISDKKFISEYNKNGQGEGEMNLIEDISTNGDSLYIVDIGNGKVIVLDIVSFVFKNDFTNYDSSGNNLLLGIRKALFDANGNMYVIVDDPIKGSVVRIFNVKCSTLSITKKYVKYNDNDLGYKNAFEFNIKDFPNAKILNLDFTLDDYNPDPTYPKTKKFSVKPGISYLIKENDVDDFDTNWVCQYPFRDSWQGLKIGKGREVNVNISSTIQEQINCTFYNFKKGDITPDATLEIVKKWSPELEHEQSFNFILSSVNNPKINEDFTLTSNNASSGSKSFGLLSDKTYSINEFITSNYHKIYSEYVCEFFDSNGNLISSKTKKGGNPTVKDVPAVSFIPKAGEKVICTFTNCKDSNRNFICDYLEGNLQNNEDGIDIINSGSKENL